MNYYCFYPPGNSTITRCRSILVSTVLQKLVRFFRMTQKPREGESECKPFPGGAGPLTSLEACAFTTWCFRHQSSNVLDPYLDHWLKESISWQGNLTILEGIKVQLTNSVGLADSWSCILKASTVKFQSMPLIDTPLILDWHSIEAPSTFQSTSLSIVN